MDTNDILRALAVGEDADWEFKSARGGVPRSLWETYSAMANTDGGTIVLGVEEDGTVSGLADAAKVRKELWDLLHNRGKISVNLLAEEHLGAVALAGATVLVLRVPRAGRQQRPVYVGQNPMEGTFRRNFEGDYKCLPEEVRRMLADSSDEPPEARIASGFTLADLDISSIQQYRNRLSARDPAHPWLALSEKDFLTRLGAYRRGRKTAEEGVTVAGLLVFGKGESIVAPEGLPQFHVDYRERLSDDPDVRWTDRLTSDGKWECNLFQFYQKVIPKLFDGMKVPFMLDDRLMRKGETPIHEAVREAVTNAIIHADYAGQGGIVIEKYRDRFEFSNPGILLLSREQILHGGISECRNKTLQKMFALLGYGERAGSGYDKIRQAWRTQNWREPRLEETAQPDRVRVVLTMVSLLPEETLARLRSRYGRAFARLTPPEVQALVTAEVEGTVSNSRLQEVTTEHPADLTRVLQGLVGKGLLRQRGQKRGTAYEAVPGRCRAPGRGSNAGAGQPGGDSLHTTVDSSHSAGNSLHSAGDSSHSGGEASHLLAEFTDAEVTRMETLAVPARFGSRLPVREMQQVIVNLCAGRYLTAVQLGVLLRRNFRSVRSRYLTPMIADGTLQWRYPNEPNRPDQAYTARRDKTRARRGEHGDRG